MVTDNSWNHVDSGDVEGARSGSGLVSHDHCRFSGGFFRREADLRRRHGRVVRSGRVGAGSDFCDDA